jgi:photosystem II stability/assembly factor-like uncharacterized protein
VRPALPVALLGVLAAVALVGRAQEPAPKDDEVARKLGISVQRVRQLHADWAMTNSALLDLPAGRLPRFLRQTRERDSPAQRAAFEALLHQDEKGVIPPDAHLRALRQLEQLRQKVVPDSRVAEILTGPQVRASSLLRPLDRVPADDRGWVALGPDAGGRTRAIVIHPTNPSTMFAGSSGGGVWKTEDGGKAWYPASTMLANFSVTCLALDPTNPDAVYAGTGEGLVAVLDLLDPMPRVPRGDGIYRTTNGGATWQRLQATHAFPYVNRLAFSPDGKVLLAAAYNPDRPGQSGIYRSTDPERARWDRCPLDADIADVKFDPTDSTRAIAGGLGFSRRSAGKTYYSKDAGRSWQEASVPPPFNRQQWDSGRVELTYTRKDPAIVYASADYQGGQLWRSTDGGRTYKRQKGLTAYQQPPSWLAKQGFYANAIWAADPTNADLVLVGGLDLWKSTDGGQTLAQISYWPVAPESPHADHHVIVAHPGFDGRRNQTVFFGNDGGIYKTDDISNAGSDRGRTNGWEVLNGNYGPIQLYGAAGNARSGTIVAGSQDNGTFRLVRKDRRVEWSLLFDGDGGYCAADPDDPKYVYGEYVGLQLFRSSGGKQPEEISGLYFENGNEFWKPSPYHIPDVKKGAALFIAPFTLDPNDPNRLLAGGERLWRTNDVKAPVTATTGPKWVPITKVFGEPGSFAPGKALPPTNLISAITVARGNSDLIWVGYMRGDLCRTTNGTATEPQWVQIGSPKPLPRRYCTRIVIDPANHHKVYAMFGGPSTDNLWKTSDDGKSWTSLGQDLLPAAPVHTLAIHPRNPDYLYLGTDVGVFLSQDAGVTWTPDKQVTNCPVRELFWMGQTLVAATYGRGLFQVDLSAEGR